MGVQTLTAGCGFPQTKNTQSVGTNIFDARPITEGTNTPAQTAAPAFGGFVTPGKMRILLFCLLFYNFNYSTSFI